LPPIGSKIDRDLTQLDLQIKKCEDQRKQVLDELDYEKEELKKARRKYD
jgi:hypothetical protein